MKPLSAPYVPGNTEAERFSNAVRTVFSVPKEAFLKEDAKWKAKNRGKRSKAKKPV
jgi:hypothetical protein